MIEVWWKIGSKNIAMWNIDSETVFI